jgi:transposase InsO family protein
VADKIAAVSGSSGRLKVQSSAPETDERAWPGQVFENLELSYQEAMLEYVAASREKERRGKKEGNDAQQQADRGSLKVQKRLLRRQEGQLRDERRQTLAQRKVEDQAWREERRRLRERISQLPVVTNWMAILVILDNCTRQCLRLRLFVAGANVTADMIVAALRNLLPPELHFLISDRGTHFQAKAFKALLHSEEFIHVLIARHRPQSNGIAERFVRTLKEWLEDKSWQDDQELALLLSQFLVEYNDRPHQGLAILGLSPNEFANRIWLM